MYFQNLKLKEKAYLLLEQFDSNLSADAFELPPFVVVKLLDGCSVVSELDELAACFLARGENSTGDVDPDAHFAWFCKEWQNPHRDAHLEDLRDEGHEPQLIWTSIIGDVVLHHLLKMTKEVRAYLNQDLAFLVNGMLERSNKFFQGAQPNKLRVFALGHLNLGFNGSDETIPVAITEIGLDNVVDDVLKLRSIIVNRIS